MSKKIKQFSERDSLKHIIMLTDGRGAYNHNLTKTAIDNDVTIYTVGLGDDLDEPLLRKIASETGGSYLYAAKAEELVDEFLTLSEDVIDFSRDSDEDGLSDYYEKKLRYSNGLRIDTDPFKKDTDGDGLLDSEEIIISEAKVTIRGREYQRVYAKMKSHPKMKDTDGDGIPYNLDSDKLVYNITDRTLALAAGLSYENLRSKKGKYVGNAGEVELSNFQVIHANNSGFITFNDFFDKGLGSVAIKMSRENKNDAIIFAFRGTEVKEDLINDFSQDILLGLGLNSTQSNKAFKKYQSLAKKYPNADFFLAGHSLGGRLVQDVLYRAHDKNNGITSFLKDDIKTPVHSATFNALGYNKIQFFSNKMFKTKTINEIGSKLNNYCYKYDRVGEQLGNSMMFKRLGTDIGPYDAKDDNGNNIPKPLRGKYYTTKVHGIKRFYDEEKLLNPKTNIY